MKGQSWPSKKILELLGSRLQFSQLYVVNRCFPSGPGSNPAERKLWAPIVPRPLDQNECLVPLLKALIPICNFKIH